MKVIVPKSCGGGQGPRGEGLTNGCLSCLEAFPKGGLKEGVLSSGAQ